MSWKTVNSTILIKNEHLTIQVNEFETAQGKKGKYWIHSNTDAVVIFAKKQNGAFVMIREYRYIFDRNSVEASAGGIELGEESEVAASREFQEETGYLAKSFKLVGTIAAVPAFSTEMLFVYLAEDLTVTERHLDAFEDIEVIEMTEEEIDQAIISGEIWNSTTIACWYLVKNYLATL